MFHGKALRNTSLHCFNCVQNANLLGFGTLVVNHQLFTVVQKRNDVSGLPTDIDHCHRRVFHFLKLRVG